MKDTTEFEILKFGPEPAVQIPAASETRDITDTVTANAAKELRQLSCR